ncbi:MULTISPECIES: TolC family outer membrane protein [unclassified Vibrio]|uniref:TolC family outer membrane protein n=1 Tax=Vibrio sp. HB236076 TaxID=3232307 RepID=A0AB39H7V3_9VIBR|nr:TolC family outer membrane protein [Vibrio sp. HB161653]MDP5253900.1 TolC family outer membrane protein [Vibrio sp. HB161653]
MRKFSLLMSLSLLSGASQALTLEQSVAQALNTHPRLMERYASFEAKYRDRRGAFSDFLPQIRLYAAYGYEEVGYDSGDELDSDLDRRELGLTITQMLFDGFRTSNEVDRLDYEAKADQQGLISTAENLSLEVVQVYLDLIKAEKLVELSRKNVDLHQSILDDINQRRKRGLSSDADVAQVESRLATSESILLVAMNNLLDIKVNYYDLVGVQAQNLVDPRPDYEFIPNRLDEAVNIAKQNHPEISAAIYDTNAAKKQMKRDKSGYYPRFDIEVDVNRNRNISGAEGRDENGRVMLTMTYDLFNGGRTRAESEASAWRYQESLAVKDNTFLEVEEATNFAWNAYVFLGKQKEFYQKNVHFAEIAQKGYDTQFELGRRSLLDVLDSQIELFSARRNYIEADFDQREAKYRLINATGRLIEALRVTTPSVWRLKEDD